jgi:hypothetical protein
LKSSKLWSSNAAALGVAPDGTIVAVTSSNGNQRTIRLATLRESPRGE